MFATKRITSVFLALCVVAAGCGGDDDDDTPDTDAAPSTGAASTPTTGGSSTPTTPTTPGEGTDAGTQAPTSEAPDGEQTEAEAYYAELAALTGEDRQSRLVEDCEAVGSIDVYSGDTLGEPLAEAFESQYGIDVELYRADSETVNQRVLQESDGGQLGGDIIISDQGNFSVLIGEGILAEYESDLLDGIAPEVAQGDDLWTATHGVVYVAAWNTDLVDEADLPDDFTGFADPSWQGRTAVEIGDFDWYATLHKYYVEQGMTEDEVDAMFTSMLGENAEPTQGHTGASELLAAGQWDVVLTTYSFIDDNFTEDGAPVAWVKEDGAVISPAVAKYVGFGLPAESKNPACALLWADWSVTEGLDVLAGEGIFTTAVDDNSLPDDIEVLTVPEEVLGSERTRWEEAFTALLQ